MTRKSKECSVSKLRSGNPEAPELAGEGVSGFPGCGTCDMLVRFVENNPNGPHSQRARSTLRYAQDQAHAILTQEMQSG